MTGQLAAILAKVHRVPVVEGLPAPAEGRSPAEEEVARFEQTYRAIAPEPHPAFELAFRWLRQNLPRTPERALVHGDYRIGNVIFGPEGARAVLDWELAHVGDPMEDLGWICVRSWRFGNDDLPVGGIGSREEFWRAYEEAGGFPVDAGRVRFWELFGNLRWGVICISQARTYLEGLSAERGAGQHRPADGGDGVGAAEPDGGGLMQDRPSYDELLGAVERFLEQEIMPNVEGSRRFHARVAANVLRIVRRELEREEEQLAAEWAGLCELLGPAERPAGRPALREAIKTAHGGAVRAHPARGRGRGRLPGGGRWGTCGAPCATSCW